MKGEVRVQAITNSMWCVAIGAPSTYEEAIYSFLKPERLVVTGWLYVTGTRASIGPKGGLIRSTVNTL